MEKERKSSDARIAANIRYNEKHVQQFKIALNKNTDTDIIEHLSTISNKQGYVKKLIRDDMANSK
jgi:hypothetical protein